MDNKEAIERDWNDGYWLLNGFDSQPVYLTGIVEDDLGMKVD